MQPYVFVGVVFFAVFTQSVSGFGVALVSMAILPGVLGIRTATPLVALIAITLEMLLLFRYRNHLDLREVWLVAAASLFGIPLGLLYLRRIDDSIILGLLGVIITLYAIYSLVNFKLPELRNPLWSVGAGLLAGMLGAAYNTSGPPVILYGNCRRWQPSAFKGNLQGFFAINSILVVAGHFISQNITPAVWQGYLLALPALGAGLLAGISLDRWINPESFRKIVLWMLVVMGIRMIIAAY